MESTSKNEIVERLEQTIERRVGLIDRLISAMSYLPHERQIRVVASWLALDDLEEMVIFQEGRERYDPSVQ